MRLDSALRDAIQFCEERGVPSPRLNAELLLMFVLECDRAYLYAHNDRELTEEEQLRYHSALRERARGVPAQYIIGHQEFWGLDFVVSPAVLIPRPETEHAVESVLGIARTMQRPETERLRIVDVGTGSGAIALAVAHELPEADVTALDISRDALTVARHNAARLKLERVRFLQSDLLSAVADERFDIVVSNPPYVGECEADRVQAEVRKFEPRIAVFGGPEGLDVVRRLIPQAYGVLVPGGWLMIEIGYTHSPQLHQMLNGWEAVHFVEDLQGIPRIAVARKP